MGNYWVDKFNVPGSTAYNPDKPVDYILRSNADARLRGYWLDRDEDGQLVFVSDQSGADYVTIEYESNDVPVIVYDDELTQELTLYGENTLGLKRYS